MLYSCNHKIGFSPVASASGSIADAPRRRGCQIAQANRSYFTFTFTGKGKGGGKSEGKGKG